MDSRAKNGTTWKRVAGVGQARGVTAGRPQDCFPSTVRELLLRRMSPGVLVFSREMTLLYCNREAMKVNRCLMNGLENVPGQGPWASALTQLCKDLAVELTAKPDPKTWERLQVLRIAGTSSDPVLLRGMGMPRSSSFVILLESLTHRRGPQLAPGARAVLTERQRAIVTCLANGLSNKEIAGELGLSTHTVKDHLRRIMQKLDTRTRTGLIAKAICSEPAAGETSPRDDRSPHKA